jgi:CheY-like chemotaxis protein
MKKILIIDDEEDFCHFVKLNLEKTGKYEVSFSTDPVQGIEIAKSERPDLILLDLLMPNMHGSEVAQKLLNDQRTQNIPIIFLTALAQKSEIDSATGMIGGRRFIAKPVTPEELVARLEEVLG